MKRKTFLGYQSPYIDWLHNERGSIILMLATIILPPVVNAIANYVLGMGGSCSCGASHKKAYDIGEYFRSPLLQAAFILVALIVLIHNMWQTNRMLKNNQKLLANYIERNTNRRIRRCSEKDFAVTVVSIIAKQFYVMWIVVWVIWLAYYLGTFLMDQLHKTDSLTAQVYRQVFDFLSSIAIFCIYLILSNVTSKRKERAEDSKGLWYGLMFLALLITTWLVLICNEGDKSSEAYQYCTLLTSIFSTISFVLVLGKLNSNYLQIPSFFLLAMYLYAIIQAYIPFAGCGGTVGVIGNVIESLRPYATLFGKLFVMLTLCWIVDKKRLVFFIIHESAALEETPALLDELDNEPVEF